VVRSGGAFLTLARPGSAVISKLTLRREYWLHLLFGYVNIKKTFLAHERFGRSVKAKPDR
jgi:hypothetical protein